MVFSSVQTLDGALALIEAADPTAAVLVDTLHRERGGASRRTSAG
jgi:hypothetical protein